MATRFLAAGLLAAAMAMTASAQRGGGSGRNSGMGDNMPMASPARMNRMDILEKALSLNKEQRKDVKNIMDEGQKEAAPLRDQLAKGRADVAAAVESGKADTVDQAVKSYAELQSKMAAIELKAFAQIYKVLDSDQQQKTRDIFPMMSGIFHGKNWMEVAP
jgi:Spy/CpxP family protein refolding chaperone